MIPVTFSWFVCIDLAVFLAGTLILWVGYELIRKRRANGIARDRVFCRICSSRYTDVSCNEVVQCPVCGSLNERGNQ